MSHNRPDVGSAIRILIDEGGAPAGSVVRVTGWTDSEEDGFGLHYSFDKTHNWLVSDNTAEDKFYEVVKVDNNSAFIYAVAEQFVAEYENGELNEDFLDYVYDVFKENLKVDNKDEG